MRIDSTKTGKIFENEQIKVIFSNTLSNDLLNALEKPTLFTKQVHGIDILEVNKLFANNSVSILEEYDGMLCKNRYHALGIQTADCVPCFLFSKNKLFSLHLGWRSLNDGLLVKALEHVSKDENSLLFIGPHIRLESFEVGPEVVEHFNKNHKDSSSWWQQENGKYHISLSKIIRHECSMHNITIYEDTTDTFTSSSHFSYRRAFKAKKTEKRRNISLAYIK